MDHLCLIVALANFHKYRTSPHTHVPLRMRSRRASVYMSQQNVHTAQVLYPCRCCCDTAWPCPWVYRPVSPEVLLTRRPAGQGRTPSGRCRFDSVDTSVLVWLQAQNHKTTHYVSKVASTYMTHILLNQRECASALLLLTIPMAAANN